MSGPLIPFASSQMFSSNHADIGLNLHFNGLQQECLARMLRNYRAAAAKQREQTGGNRAQRRAAKKRKANP